MNFVEFFFNCLCHGASDIRVDSSFLLGLVEKGHG